MKGQFDCVLLNVIVLAPFDFGLENICLADLVFAGPVNDGGIVLVPQAVNLNLVFHVFVWLMFHCHKGKITDCLSLSTTIFNYYYQD